MSKQIKNIIILVVVLIVTTSVALPIFGSENNYKNITLEYLKDRILDNNLDMRRARKNKSIAEHKENKAIEEEDDIASTDVETAKNSKYYPLEAQMNVFYTNWVKDDTEEKKTLEGIKKYLTYQFMENKIELQNEKIKRLEDELATVNIKISLGKATVNDRATAQLSIQEETYNLHKLTNERDILFLDLNLLMDNDLDTQLEFKEIEEVPFEKYTAEDDIDDQIEDVLKHNGELNKLKDENHLANIELEIYEDNNSSGNYDSNISKLEETKKNLDYDIEDKELSLEYQVRSQYNELLNAYDALSIKELEIDNLEIGLNATEKRYEVGLESKNNLALAKENLAFAQLELDKAKLDYYVAVETYKNFVD